MSSNSQSEPTFRDCFSRPPGEAPGPAAPRRRGVGAVRWFMGFAVLFAVVFGLLHAAGLRQYTSVLNGTIGQANASWETSVFLGALYILSYLGFVLLSPILLLAAALLKIFNRIALRSTTVEVMEDPSHE